MGRQKKYTDFNENHYIEILNMVKKGSDIHKAIHSIKMDLKTFYRYITKEQKAELKFFKTTTLFAPVPLTSYNRKHAAESASFFNDDYDY